MLIRRNLNDLHTVGLAANVMPLGAARLDTAIKEALAAAPHRPGSVRRDDDFYRLVARAYIDLLGKGHPAPIRKLATETGRHRDTVGSWLRGARDRGFLTDTPTETQ